MITDRFFVSTRKILVSTFFFFMWSTMGGSGLKREWPHAKGTDIRH